MFLPILLVAFAAAPAPASVSPAVAAPAPRLEAAGWLRDAHVELNDDGMLHLRARVEGPWTLDRRTFQVDVLDASGRVMSTRMVRGCLDAGSPRHHRARMLHVDVRLDGVANAAEVRVRSVG